MKKRYILLFALSVALILAASINSAFAYFTTYAEAEGGYTIRLGGSKTHIEEGLSGWTKHVVIVNDYDSSRSVFVRARVFAGEGYNLNINDGGNTDHSYGENGERIDWSDYILSEGGWYDGGDGYWYFRGIVAPGERTSELRVAFSIPEGSTDDFNIIVIYESTPVQYDENGNSYADWTLKAKTE